MDVDPPDVQKIPPYSRVEAWVDPADAGYRVVEMIGKNLQVFQFYDPDENRMHWLFSMPIDFTL